MRKRLPLLIAASIALASAASLGAAGDEIDAATKAKIAQFDKGPSSVDVSSYPAAAKANYNVFRNTCSLCHTLARPINCDFALPDEWSRYVKRMMFKPSSNITPEKAKKIYQFLVYDTTVRKKDLLDKALAAATPEDKAAALSKIEEVRAILEAK
jgi:cytochrome c5